MAASAGAEQAPSMSSGATTTHAASPCAYCGDDAAPLACERCGAAAFCDASCRKLGARAHRASCDAVVATRGQAAACGRSAAAARAAAASEARLRAAVRVERRDLERRARAAARRARDARDDVDCHAVRVSGAGPVAVAGPAFAVSDGTLREVSRLLEPLARCEIVDGMVVLAFEGGDPAPFLRAMAGAFPGDAPASVAAARAAALSLPVPRSLRRLLAGVCRGDVVADGARLRVAHAARQDPDDDESADAALRRTVARLGGAAE